MLRYSQAGQDLFALKNFPTGYYLEIGASHPINISNTYLLEQNGWLGISIDIDPSNELEWNKSRKNPLFILNALECDFSHFTLKRYEYLSLDIEPPQNTFKCFQRLIEAGFEFGCVTFETDYYADQSIRDQSRIYFKEKGYTLFKPSVMCDFGEFEDWYINESYDSSLH